MSPKRIITQAELKLLAEMVRDKADNLVNAAGVEQAITTAHGWVRAYPHDPVKRVFWRAVLRDLQHRKRMNDEKAKRRPG